MSASEKSEFAFEGIYPFAPLKICALESIAPFAERVNAYLTEFRSFGTDSEYDEANEPDQKRLNSHSYLVENSCPRFGSGEGKGMILESVRGSDLYIMVDVINYSMTYTICGHENHTSPDDHYRDLKRIIAAASGAARRINVVMPFLYEGRQHRRTKRESLDCALMLQELTNMGVASIITFDAHDPRMVNAIPLHTFDNYTPPYQFMKAIFNRDRSLVIDKDHLLVISPDEGAMARATYFASNLGVNIGMFYKRRDYTTVVNGKNPVVAHEFLGQDVTDKTMIVVDDMIASGESILDTARALKERGAGKVIICCTFGLFTEGFAKFDEFYKNGYFDYIVTTNLNYRDPSIFDHEWYIEADMTKFTAAIINTMNHDQPTSNILEPTKRIQRLINRYNAEIKEEFEQGILDIDFKENN